MSGTLQVDSTQVLSVTTFVVGRVLDGEISTGDLTVDTSVEILSLSIRIRDVPTVYSGMAVRVELAGRVMGLQRGDIIAFDATGVTDLIQRRWGQRLMPLINGILFSDGRIVLFSGQPQCETDQNVDSPVADSTLESFLWYRPEPWRVHLDLGSCLSNDKKLRLVTGVGPFERGGFVALVDEPSNKLRWIATFRSSGAFREGRFSDGFAEATNELEQIWRFPPDSPVKVEVAG